MSYSYTSISPLVSNVKVTPYETTVSIAPTYPFVPFMDYKSQKIGWNGYSSSALSLSPFSPLSPVDIALTPDPLKLNYTQPDSLFISNMYPIFTTIDTGLNENILAQTQMLEYIMGKIYDEWIYDDISHVMKYLRVVDDDKIDVIEKKEDYATNKLKDDTGKIVEKKITFIEKKILTKSDVKKLLKRMIDELDYKWFEFSKPNKLAIVQEVVEKYIRHKLKHIIHKNNK
jgi:hypothetical protein